MCAHSCVHACVCPLLRCSTHTQSSLCPSRSLSRPSIKRKPSSEKFCITELHSCANTNKFSKRQKETNPLLKVPQRDCRSFIFMPSFKAAGWTDKGKKRRHDSGRGQWVGGWRVYRNPCEDGVSNKLPNWAQEALQVWWRNTSKALF